MKNVATQPRVFERLRCFGDGRRMPLHGLDLDLMQGPGVKELFKAIISAREYHQNAFDARGS